MLTSVGGRIRSQEELLGDLVVHSLVALGAVEENGDRVMPVVFINLVLHTGFPSEVNSALLVALVEVTGPGSVCLPAKLHVDPVEHRQDTNRPELPFVLCARLRDEGNEHVLHLGSPNTLALRVVIIINELLLGFVREGVEF